MIFLGLILELVCASESTLAALVGLQRFDESIDSAETRTFSFKMPGGPGADLAPGAFDFLFPSFDLPRGNRSTCPATLQPSISTFHCCSLNKLILACYHFAWLLSPISDQISQPRARIPIPFPSL